MYNTFGGESDGKDDHERAGTIRTDGHIPSQGLRACEGTGIPDHQSRCKDPDPRGSVQGMADQKFDQRMKRSGNLKEGGEMSNDLR